MTPDAGVIARSRADIAVDRPVKEERQDFHDELGRISSSADALAACGALSDVAATYWFRQRLTHAGERERSRVAASARDGSAFPRAARDARRHAARRAACRQASLAGARPGVCIYTSSVVLLWTQAHLRDAGRPVARGPAVRRSGSPGVPSVHRDGGAVAHRRVPRPTMRGRVGRGPRCLQARHRSSRAASGMRHRAPASTGTRQRAPVSSCDRTAPA